MRLDPRVIAIAKQFEPGLPLANWTDDNRRAWVIQVIEQVVFRFPNAGWGAKRTGPRRPLSKDAIALERDGHVWAFDLVNRSTKRVNDTVEGVLIDDQVFVRVAGKDHLGMVVTGAGSDAASAREPEAPDASAGAEDDRAVLDVLQAIQATLVTLGTRLDRLEEASDAGRSDLNALKQRVEQIAAAVKAPGSVTIKGGATGS